jgi:gliding motility-associated-like protein
MNRLLSILFVMLVSIGFSQELERQVIGATGHSSDNGSISISGTVGETMVRTVEGNNIIITEGFQQPEIRIIIEAELKVYTGITPNGDGINDTWYIDGISLYPENNVIIYGRWGEKIWEGINYDNNLVIWDGKDQNGNVLTDGTYIYFISLTNGPDVPSSWVQLTN